MSRLRRRRVAWQVFRRLNGTYLMAGALGLADPNGAQCTHVPNFYWRALGVGNLFGNASGWIGEAPEGCEYLPLTDRVQLEAGDVAVFRSEFTGPGGHVDVVLDGTQRPWLGLDQNWPLGSDVHRVWHGLDAVAGVIRAVG